MNSRGLFTGSYFVRYFFTHGLILALSALLVACGGAFQRVRPAYPPACQAHVESKLLMEELAGNIEKFIGVPRYSAQTLAEGAFLTVFVSGGPLADDDIDPATLTGAFSTARQLGALADIARTLNFIPETGQAGSPDGRTLWDAYGAVLDQAQVATNQLSNEELRRLDQARRFVARKAEAHNRYRQAYDQAWGKYVEAKLNAEASGGAALKQWLEHEPRIRAQVDAAYSDWLAKGEKAGFDEANATIGQLQGRAPLLAWQQWKEQFHMARRTDFDRGDFWLTLLHPSNIEASGATSPWTRVTIAYPVSAGPMPEPAGSRIGDLLLSRRSHRPAALVIQFSAELMRAEIIRPWLNPALFRSAFWRWSDSREPLSDGQTPPRGNMVAYPSAVVLARDLEIRLLPMQIKAEATPAETEPAMPTPDAPQAAQTHPNEPHPNAACNSLRFDGAKIVGFVNRLLPRSPNPDPGLDWRAGPGPEMPTPY